MKIVLGKSKTTKNSKVTASTEKKAKSTAKVTKANMKAEEDATVPPTDDISKVPAISPTDPKVAMVLMQNCLRTIAQDMHEINWTEDADITEIPKSRKVASLSISENQVYADIQVAYTCPYDRVDSVLNQLRQIKPASKYENYISISFQAADMASDDPTQAPTKVILETVRCNFPDDYMGAMLDGVPAINDWKKASALVEKNAKELLKQLP